MLRDSVPLVQFKKREKYPWRSGTLKVTLFHGCFLHFLNCTNGTKLRKACKLFSEKTFRNEEYLDQCDTQ